MDYSQYGEQKFLTNYFKNVMDGVLVDIGAADGVNNSNTKKLIENGWSGILVEPNIKNYNKLLDLHKNNNKINIENCGCSNKNSTKVKFFIDKNDEFEQISTFSEEQHIKCKTIYNCDFVETEVDLLKTSDLFKKYNLSDINFISIDAEGYDSLIIDGIDFEKINISLICVEDINYNSDKKLIDGGYNLIFSTIGNKFYEKKI